MLRFAPRKLFKIALLAAAFGTLAVVPGALAQSPVLGGYGGSGGVNQSNIDPRGGSTAVGGVTANRPRGGTGVQHVGGGGSSVPFTGLDLLFVGTAGVMLLVAGFGLRRLTRRRRSKTV